jgi:hypothetical protein
MTSCCLWERIICMYVCMYVYVYVPAEPRSLSNNLYHQSKPAQFVSKPEGLNFTIKCGLDLCSILSFIRIRNHTYRAVYACAGVCTSFKPLNYVYHKSTYKRQIRERMYYKCIHSVHICTYIHSSLWWLTCWLAYTVHCTCTQVPLCHSHSNWGSVSGFSTVFQ